MSRQGIEDEHAWRFVPLEGGNNFRDIGGWTTVESRKVVVGRAYRAATLHDLSDGDVDRIAALGFADVVDLRGDKERRHFPSRRPEPHQLSIWEKAGAEAQGDLSRVMAQPGATVAEFRAVMLGIYSHLPYTLAAGFRQILVRLAQGDGPVLFHCAAGKDRTGVAGAILLTALGVEPAQVRQDYLLTNRTSHLTFARFKRGYALDDLEANAPGSIEVIFGAHEAFLDAAFAAIEKNSGSFGAYLKDTLHFDEDAQARLQAAMLEG